MTKYRRSSFQKKHPSRNTRVLEVERASKTPRRGRMFWLKGGLTLSVIAMGMAYFVQVNVVSQEGFALRDLEQHIETVSIQNQELMKQTAQLRSLARVQKASSTLGLIPSENLVYLPGETEPVALGTR